MKSCIVKKKTKLCFPTYNTTVKGQSIYHLIIFRIQTYTSEGMGELEENYQ